MTDTDIPGSGANPPQNRILVGIDGSLCYSDEGGQTWFVLKDGTVSNKVTPFTNPSSNSYECVTSMSAFGKYIAFTDDSGNTYVYKDSELVQTIPLPASIRSGDSPYGVGISPDGKYIWLVGGANQSLTANRVVLFAGS